MTLMFYTLSGFAVFFVVAWICLWLLHLLALCYSKYKLHRNTKNFCPETPLPGISILKPLKGIDPNLTSNLETYFTMDYPKYEILFCIEDKDDPAVTIVNELMRKYQEVDAQLLIGGCRVGVNPKINNMQIGYECSKYDFVLISDSGIRMKADSLKDMAMHLTDRVAIVHQMPFTYDSEGFVSIYEKIFFGTIQARMYLCADLLGINCHVGMSSLMRKEALNEVGGLACFGIYLAEDYFIAQAVRSRGWKLVVSSHPALQNSGGVSVSGFQARLRRWTQLRVAMLPLTAILEPISECIPLGAAVAWALGFLFPHFIEPGAIFLVHLLAWFISDYLLLRAVQNGPLPFNKVQFAIGWFWREICGPVLFVRAVMRQEIKWRTRRYRLDWGGRAHEIKCHEFDSFIKNEC